MESEVQVQNIREEYNFEESMSILSNFALDKKISLYQIAPFFIKLGIHTEIWESLQPVFDIPISPEVGKIFDLKLVPLRMLEQKRPLEEIIEYIRLNYSFKNKDEFFVKLDDGNIAVGHDLVVHQNFVNDFCSIGIPILLSDLVEKEVIEKIINPDTQRVHFLRISDSIRKYITAYCSHYGHESIQQALKNIIEGFQIPLKSQAHKVPNAVEQVLQVLSKSSIYHIIAPLVTEAKDFHIIIEHIEMNSPLITFYNVLNSIKPFLLKQSELGNIEIVFQILRTIQTGFYLEKDLELIVQLIENIMKGEDSDIRYRSYIFELLEIVFGSEGSLNSFLAKVKDKEDKGTKGILILKLFKYSKAVEYTKARKYLLHHIKDIGGDLYNYKLPIIGAILLADSEDIKSAFDEEIYLLDDDFSKFLGMYGRESFYLYARVYWERIDFDRDIQTIIDSGYWGKNETLKENTIGVLARILVEEYVANNQLHKLSAIINSRFCNNLIMQVMIGAISANYKS